MAEKKPEVVDRALANRLARVPKGNKEVEAAMRIEDRVKRADKLWDLGYCTNGYGTCNGGTDGGTIQRLAKKKDGSMGIYCAACTESIRKANANWRKGQEKEAAKPKARAAHA